MTATYLVAVWLFAITNVDALLVLAAFCTDDRYSLRVVFLGHFLAVGVVVIGIVVGSVAAAELLREWAFLLGTIPIGIGLWGLFRRRPDGHPVDDGVQAPLGRVTAVVGAGIGVSGENVAIFVPFFTALSPTAAAWVVVLYLVGSGVVFLAAVVLARRAESAGVPPWVERWLVPTLLVVVGVFVIATGLLAL